MSTSGGVLLGDSAVVDVSGGDGGKGGVIDIRMQRDKLLTLADTNADNDLLHLGGTIRGQSRLDIEGYQAYERTSIGAADVIANTGNVLYADASAFALKAGDILKGLGRSGDQSARVLTGIEIDSTL